MGNWFSGRLVDLSVAVHLRLQQERGEGVISTAIAVLIVALLGAAMWAAFQGIFNGATENIGSAVDSISG